MGERREARGADQPPDRGVAADAGQAPPGSAPEPLLVGPVAQALAELRAREGDGFLLEPAARAIHEL